MQSADFLSAVFFYLLDEVILLQDGKVLRQAAVDELREETGESVDAYFREVYKC